MPDFGQREDKGESEFGWGSGLTQPGLEAAPPSQGGRYRGKTPPMPNNPALDDLQRLIDGEGD
ncbi:MAG: hypothetical protein WBD41_00500 [Rhodococcus sp. (in: high G+C Gram-positive bacteria)]|jgi:hypothetical protein|uniref:hypothetical protein n=1 Tax=Rhodococcus sp. EPR-157 TaxID=1813677 RepID=UPI0007BAF553|nr:hypothetical protein [Rhodococcus sp. EPR-157]KZE98910.1 hypothetical protein A2J03_13130 [Rhodococcus sp. EPR-157]